MDLFDAIHHRRSVRRFLADPIPADVVERLLRAAMAAPSAGNQQPWQFVVIDDRSTLDAVPRFHQHARMLTQAPLAVLVCATPATEKHKGYFPQDCAAATQNLLLAAHGLGLGACWLGIHTRPEREQGLRELLGIPADVVPYSLIALGRPAETPAQADRYDAARVHRNRW